MKRVPLFFLLVVVGFTGGMLSSPDVAIAANARTSCERDKCMWGYFCDRALSLTGCNKTGTVTCETYICEPE